MNDLIFITQGSEAEARAHRAQIEEEARVRSTLDKHPLVIVGGQEPGQRLKKALDLAVSRLAALGCTMSPEEIQSLYRHPEPSHKEQFEALATSLHYTPPPPDLTTLLQSSYERSHPNQPFYRKLRHRRRK